MDETSCRIKPDIAGATEFELLGSREKIMRLRVWHPGHYELKTASEEFVASP